jgi:hypothetical protein
MAVEACGTTIAPFRKRERANAKIIANKRTFIYCCRYFNYPTGGPHSLIQKEEIHTNLFLIDFTVSCLDYS